MRGAGRIASVAPVGATSGYPDFLPRVLPATWRVIESRPDGAAFARGEGLRVIASSAIELDGKRWLHVSCSRAVRLPTWDDLGDVKALFIGPGRYAYQVFPPASKHVNLHSYCLHLWCCLDGDAVLPDFTRGGGTI